MRKLFRMVASLGYRQRETRGSYLNRVCFDKHKPNGNSPATLIQHHVTDSLCLNGD